MVLSNCEIDRSVQSLSGKWQFKYDREASGDSAGYFKAENDRSNWTSLNIPAIWDDPQYDGVGWYATSFNVRKSLTVGRIAVVFESVDDDAVVYLNGEKVGEHGGYGVRFYFDVSDKIKLHQSNTLVVRINDTGGAGGITGNVLLRSYEDESELLKTEYSEAEAIPVPDWLRTACIYEVFVRVYSPEGNFQALTADLPRIKSMGYDCLWLMPIFPIGEKNRKGSLGSPYSIRDFRAINPDLGNEQDLKTLIDNAHKMNIKVILDIACNHSSWDNLLIEQYPNWYTRDEQSRIISPNSDWSDVADFNYNSVGLREYMWGSLEYWVKEFDIDGYRLDVAELVPDDFWKEALNRLQTIKSDILMLAEGDHPRLYLNGFHLSYGWNTRRAYFQIIRKNHPAGFLGETLTKEYFRYPKRALKMRFTENHDEERTAALYTTEQARLLTFLTFTLPGVPMIYAGQEVAANAKPSLFEKSQIDWRQFDGGMIELISRMNVLRRENPILTVGEYKLLKSPRPEKIFMFSRNAGSGTALIIVNMKDVAGTVTIDLKVVIPNIGKTKPELLMSSGTYLYEDQRIIIPCTGYDYYLFILESN